MYVVCSRNVLMAVLCSLKRFVMLLKYYVNYWKQF